MMNRGVKFMNSMSAPLVELQSMDMKNTFPKVSPSAAPG
jgi:hypothetical protein